MYIIFCLFKFNNGLLDKQNNFKAAVYIIAELQLLYIQLHIISEIVIIIRN